MKACTAKHPCSHTTIAEIVYCGVHHSEQPLKAIADALGVRPGYLADAANPDRAEVQFQLRLFLPLLRYTGRTDLFEAFASLAGFVAFEPPEGNPSIDMLRESASAMRRFADFVDTTAAAIADGRVTPAEARTMSHQGRLVMSTTASLVAAGSRAAGLGPVLIARQERVS